MQSTKYEQQTEGSDPLTDNSTDGLHPATALAPRLPIAKFIPLLALTSQLALVLSDGPTVVRMPLAVIATTVATGAPIVGMLRLPRSTARTLLTIGSGLAMSVLVSEVLLLGGRLTATSTAVALLGLNGLLTLVWVWHGGPVDPRVPVQERLARARRAPWLPTFITATTIPLWVASALYMRPRLAGEAGLVNVLPPSWWIGVMLVTLAFLIHMRTGLNVPLAVVQVGMLVAFLYVVVTVSEPFARIPTSYTHVGLVDYLVRDGQITSYFDARYSWPGSLSLGAMITQLAGAESSAALAKWALPMFVALWALAMHSLASAVLTPRSVSTATEGLPELPWIATWVFLSLNWVGQDYLSSQALNFFLLLVVVTAVLTWFPRRRGQSRFPGLLPGQQPPPLDATQRLGLFLVLSAICAAVASSHQLSPFVLTGALTVLWLVDRRDVRWLPLVAGVFTLVWLSWGAEDYWVGHLSRLTESVGEVGDVVSAGTSARASEATLGRRLVLATRLLLSAGAWVLAAATAYLSWRTRRETWRLTVAALGLVPFGAIAFQEYGGELGLRIFLFSLPCIAVMLTPTIDRSLLKRRRRPLVAALVAMMVVGTIASAFVLARYGNEQFEQVYEEDVAVVQEYYRIAPPGTLVIGNNTSNPFRMGPYDDHRPRKVQWLAQPEQVDVEDALRDAGADEGYVLITEAGIKEAVLRQGASSGWEDRLHEQLMSMGAVEVFRQGRAALYEFTIDNAAEPTAAPKPPRSLASEFVRNVLGLPALFVALALTTLIVVAGALHAARRRQDALVFAIGCAGTFGLVGIVAARFVAMT